jgi:hypothetical protein
MKHYERKIVSFVAGYSQKLTICLITLGSARAWVYISRNSWRSEGLVLCE